MDHFDFIIFLPLLNGVRVSCAPSLATKDVVSEDPFFKNSLFPPLSLFTKKKQQNGFIVFNFSTKIHLKFTFCVLKILGHVHTFYQRLVSLWKQNLSLNFGKNLFNPKKKESSVQWCHSGYSFPKTKILKILFLKFFFSSPNFLTQILFFLNIRFNFWLDLKEIYFFFLCVFVQENSNRHRRCRSLLTTPWQF